MPASRSRTVQWRKSLDQIHERNGALEITLPRYVEGADIVGDPETGEGAANLVWRVRIMALSDTEIVVEEPMALGQVVPLKPGIELVGIIVVGQNRWMFRTTHLGFDEEVAGPGRSLKGIRLKMPENVERCQRRNFYRVSTETINLPLVECYPLLDLNSAVVAEAANRVEILDAQDAPIADAPDHPDEDKLPDVGPMVPARVMNVGGGGVGLLVEPTERMAFDRYNQFWLRISLLPHIPAPLGVVGRLRHTHIDSEQRMYAGMSFEFASDSKHEEFVVDQLCKYVAQVQREQLGRPGNI